MPLFLLNAKLPSSLYILRSRVYYLLNAPRTPQDRIFGRNIDIIYITHYRHYAVYFASCSTIRLHDSATSLSRNLQDRYRIIIRNKAIPYSLYTRRNICTSYLRYRTHRSFSGSRIHEFRSKSARLSLFLFSSLFLDTSYSRSKSPPTGIRSLGAPPPPHIGRSQFRQF